MKKKILLKTLIPLTTMGIGLGVALPLVSCSCGNNENNGGINVFSDKQDLLDFIADTSSKVFIDDADAHKDWSSKATNDLEMITWFKARLDAQIVCLILINEQVNGIDFTYPCEYQFTLGVASCSFVSSRGSIDAVISKNTDSSFNVIYMINGNVFLNGSGSIIEAGTTSGGVRIIRFDQILGDPNFLSNMWPDVKFPTAAPNLSKTIKK